MKVLVVGGGGREHALVWKLAQSPRVSALYAAPGNPGIAALAKCVPIAVDNVAAIAKFAVSESIDLVAVGPEIPLCMGLVDLLQEAGIPAFGPSAAASRIEGSKVFSKRIMRKYHIPTAAFEDFDDFTKALSYVRALNAPVWIKASGLAAGKGAVFAKKPDDAEVILRRMMLEDEFGESGHAVVIEEHMHGDEASIFALCDGTTYRLLATAQDHKRVFDNDQGPNTGGMGAYGPTPLITPDLLRRIEKEIIQPTIDGMAAEDAPYHGLLYTGVTITADGPRVIEYNCRFGDPETQAVLPLLDGDLAELMLACCNGTLASTSFGTLPGAALCVVVASGGYPGPYAKGIPITGVEAAASHEGVQVFHAGTRLDEDSLVTAGGRVFGVTGVGADFTMARKRAYEAVSDIRFEGAFWRSDIGGRALNYITGL